MSKFILFLFAYIPIYIIAALKTIDPTFVNCIGYFIGFKKLLSNNIQPFLLIILSISLVCYFKAYERSALKATGTPVFKIKSITSQNKEYITYLGTYILPFIALETKTIFDVLAYIFLFLTMGFIYARTNLIYTNPMLLFFDYEIFEVIDSDNDKLICISKHKLNSGDEPIGVNLGEKTFLIAKWRKEN
ncbi:MAG: hypothetical protein JNJ41_11480 [Bacteroidia bacterium]|nr:hypothetical protein [Bacteroidia bacterium]